MKVYRQWVPCERNSSYNFIPIFLKLCTCFRHGLEMCMWFGYNRWINFCHFFHFVNFVIFWPQILWKCIDSGYHVSATPYTTSCLSLFNFAHLFVHGLKMCMWFGFNPAVNFCHFSTLLTLSFFAGATSTSPKFDLFLFNYLTKNTLYSFIWATSWENLFYAICKQQRHRSDCTSLHSDKRLYCSRPR